MTTTIGERLLTPPQVAQRLRIKPERVIAMIRSGELRGSDVASRGSRRPRYRIDPADLAAWLAGRAVVAATRPIPRRRPANVIEFY